MAMLSRRAMLAGALRWRRHAGVGAAARAKGPLVWMDMDQKELDDAYDQAVYAPNAEIVIKRCIRNSELARERLGAAEALQPTARPVRGARRVHGQDAERADHDLGPRRLLAGRHGLAVPLCGRDVPQRRREFRRAGLRQRRRRRRQSAHHGRPDPPLGGLGLQERQAASAAIRSASMSPANRPAATGSAC